MSGKTDTGERILDAALATFAEKGFSAATTKIIAEKASVNEVTLFRYFGTKENIFLAAIDREADVRMDIIRIKLEPSEDMASDLAEIGKYIAKNMLERADFFRLLVREAERFPQIWEHIGTVPVAGISKLREYFESAKERGLVRTDIDSEAMALSFFSFLFRILVANAFLGEDRFTKMGRDESIAAFAEIFVNGIRKRSG